MLRPQVAALSWMCLAVLQASLLLMAPSLHFSSCASNHRKMLLYLWTGSLASFTNLT